MTWGLLGAVDMSAPHHSPWFPEEPASSAQDGSGCSLRWGKEAWCVSEKSLNAVLITSGSQHLSDPLPPEEECGLWAERYVH